MKLTVAELTMIATTLSESAAIADRADGLGVFTWPSATRLALANRLLEGMNSMHISVELETAPV